MAILGQGWGPLLCRRSPSLAAHSQRQKRCSLRQDRKSTGPQIRSLSCCEFLIGHDQSAEEIAPLILSMRGGALFVVRSRDMEVGCLRQDGGEC